MIRDRHFLPYADSERVVVPGGLNEFRVFLRRLFPRRLYVKATGRSVNE